MNENSRLTLWRFIPVIGWLIGIALAVGAPYVKETPKATPNLVAARDLTLNQRIAWTDLTASDANTLVGHYLLRDVRQGQTITPTMVSEKPSPAQLPNTIAAIIDLPDAKRRERGIEIGSVVSIVRGQQTLQAAGRVLALNCDAVNCAIIVGLRTMPDQIVDPGAFAGADLLPFPPLPCCGDVGKP